MLPTFVPRNTAATAPQEGRMSGDAVPVIDLLTRNGTRCSRTARPGRCGRCFRPSAIVPTRLGKTSIALVAAKKARPMLWSPRTQCPLLAVIGSPEQQKEEHRASVLETTQRDAGHRSWTVRVREGRGRGQRSDRPAAEPDVRHHEVLAAHAT